MIVVVGGGLAGLRAALTVQESGQQVHLIEANDYVGGRLSSTTIDGFTIDRGFQVVNPGYQELQKLDIRTHFHSIPAGAVARIGERWRFFGDPRRELRALANALPSVVINPAEFLALLRAIFFSDVRVGEDTGTFLHRIGVDGEVYECLIAPFLRGVFLTELKEVDAKFARRVLRSLYRQVPGLPDGGVAALAMELRNRVKSIQSGSRVESITRSGTGFVVTCTSASATFTARKVIVATDYLSAQHFSSQLSTVDHAHSTAWYFTLEEPISAQHQLHVAQSDTGPVVTAIDVASIVPSYSPDGRGLLSVTTLIPCTEAQVRTHLTQIYGGPITGDLITRFDIPNALPIIAPAAKRTGIHEEDGIIFAGDYLTEPSQNGALLSGRLAGERACN